MFLDRDATIEKCCRLIAEAGANGADLVVFPEAFVPGYPLWVWHIPAGQTKALRELYAMLLENAVSIPAGHAARLCQAAREAGVHVVVGVNERNDEASGTTLYNSLVYIGAGGELLGVHRKLVPTSGERLVHAQGGGETLAVYDLAIGKLSGLICWENYMPLARYALYAWGVQIYVAPTWDRGEPWLSTLRHIAKEGRVYVIGCCSVVHRDHVPDRLSFKEQFLPPQEEWLNPGDSVIVDPDGRVIAGPIRCEEAILYADVDPVALRGPRWQLDVAGHYARPDVFQLTVHRGKRSIVTVDDEPAPSREIVDASKSRPGP